MPLDDILAFAHRVAGEALAPGDWVVDATAGNGHDTRFLAEAVGAEGRVWAFDVQRAALQSTRRRLEAEGLDGRVTLLERGHEALRDALPSEAEGRLGAVTFNLGYLPGSDKAVITRPETTCAALDAATAFLAPRGVVTAVCYTGHDGGRKEAEAVRQWAESLPPERFRVLGYRFLNARGGSPHLVAVEKRAAG